MENCQAETPVRSIRLRVITFLPFCLIAMLLIVSAFSGKSLISNAHASEITVTGTVDPGVFLDASQCTASSGTIGEVIPAVDGWKTAQMQSNSSCTLSFGTLGSTYGANLVLIDDPSKPGVSGPAMRCTVGACAGKSVSDYSGSNQPPVGTSAFGTQLLNTGGIASAAWSTAPAVHAVQDTSDIPCQTSALGTGSCSFTWGITTATENTPGAYSAFVQALAVAR